MVKNKNLKRKPTPLLNNKKAPESKQIVEEAEYSDEEVNNICLKMKCLKGSHSLRIFLGIGLERRK